MALACLRPAISALYCICLLAQTPKAPNFDVAACKRLPLPPRGLVSDVTPAGVSRSAPGPGSRLS